VGDLNRLITVHDSVGHQDPSQCRLSDPRHSGYDKHMLVTQPWARLVKRLTLDVAGQGALDVLQQRLAAVDRPSPQERRQLRSAGQPQLDLAAFYVGVAVEQALKIVRAEDVRVADDPRAEVMRQARLAQCGQRLGRREGVAGKARSTRGQPRSLLAGGGSQRRERASREVFALYDVWALATGRDRAQVDAPVGPARERFVAQPTVGPEQVRDK
jgi:hypothetical protein